MREEKQTASERDDISIDEKSQLEKEIEEKIEELHGLRPLKLLTDSKYREFRRRYGDVFEADTGAQAVLTILKNSPPGPSQCTKRSILLQGSEGRKPSRDCRW